MKDPQTKSPSEFEILLTTNLWLGLVNVISLTNSSRAFKRKYLLFWYPCSNSKLTSLQFQMRCLKVLTIIIHVENSIPHLQMFRECTTTKVFKGFKVPNNISRLLTLMSVEFPPMILVVMIHSQTFLHQAPNLKSQSSQCWLQRYSKLLPSMFREFLCNDFFVPQNSLS